MGRLKPFRCAMMERGRKSGQIKENRLKLLDDGRADRQRAEGTREVMTCLYYTTL